MDDQENESEHEEYVNEESRNVKNYECPNPREKHQEREHQK
jgi:hypothetical protein